VALVTFALTFWVDLTVGVAFGLGVSAVMLILRLRVISHCRAVSVDGVPPGVRVLEVSGIFFYAVAEDLTMRVQKMIDREPGVRVVVLEVSHLLSVDYDGLLALQDLMEDMGRRGWHLILCRLQPQPARFLLRHGLLERIGLENLCGSLEQALGRARVVAGGDQPAAATAD
jgi:sulfate permease, SulP family